MRTRSAGNSATSQSASIRLLFRACMLEGAAERRVGGGAITIRDDEAD
jgi:hypothetical protein